MPYAFDGGMTVTVLPARPRKASSNWSGSSPKRNRRYNLHGDDGGRQAFSTIAEVTFFGRDQAGNEVTVSGNITVSFADYGDPD